MPIERRQQGFTMIEVLVSLVFVALSLGAVLAAVTQMADASIAMQQRSYASWIAQNKIAEMRLRNVFPEVEETRGEVTYANQEWRWVAAVSETGVENLFRVDVAVHLAEEELPVRTVTGFIGEPVPPGMANNTWNALTGTPDRDGGDGPGQPDQPGAPDEGETQ